MVSHFRQMIRQKERTGRYLQTLKYLGLLHKNASEVNQLRDVTKAPPPYPFHKDIIFIAIDFEAWEREPRPITEIGIAVLDTRDLKIPPGENNETWYERIRGRHFIIQEHVGRINSEHVAGCPDDFLFGSSVHIKEADIAATLKSIFQEAYRSSTQHGEDSSVCEPKMSPEAKEQRNIVVVAHGATSDLKYCEDAGFNLLQQPGYVQCIDTASLYCASIESPQPTSLAKIMYSHGIAAWGLHNAGNDAVYTLQIMLAMCLQATSLPVSGRIPVLEEKPEQQTTADEDDGWEL